MENTQIDQARRSGASLEVRLITAIIVTTALAAGVLAGTMVSGGGRAGATRPDVQPIDDNTSPSPSGPPTVDDSCADGGCDFQLPDGSGVVVTDDTTVTENQDGNIEVRGTVEIPTAAGPIELVDADLELGTGPDGETIIVGGTAEVPFPKTGFLGGAVINQLPEGIVGMDYGRDLHDLGAHLQDDRQYIWFHFDGGLDIDLPFAGQPGYEAVPPSIEVPTGMTATMVLDPTDPYFYVGMPCPDFEKQDEDSEGDEDQKQDDEDAENDEDQKQDEDEEALVTLEPIGGVGQDCGLGFSMQGNIPAPAIEGLDAFFGHIVVDGIIPLPSAMELDGTVVVEIRDDRVRTSGGGELSATVPLISDLLDIEIPIGDATVDLQMGGGKIAMGFEGQVGGTEPTYEIPLLGVPFTLPSDGSIEASALIAWNISPEGVWSIDSESHFEMSGHLTMGFTPFTDELGLSLGESAIEGGLRIDTQGIHVNGSTTSQLHPSLATNASMNVEALLAFDDFSRSFVSLDGELVVVGVTLGQGSIDLSEQGLFVSGMLTNTITTVEMRGQITPDGVNLSGATTVEFPLDVLSRLSEAAVSGIDAAQAEVDRLDVEIERLREEVRQGRKERDADFQFWTDALTTAQAEVGKLQNNIDINTNKIAGLHRSIRSEKDWFAGLTGPEQAWHLTGHGIRLAGFAGEIAALETANAGQWLLMEGAQAALEAAKEGLRLIEAGLDAIPVDADPRILTLIGLREAATLTLDVAREAAKLIDFEGTLRGQISWTLGTDGLSGAVVAEFCTDTCTTLAGGSVTVLPVPEACIEVLDLEACVSL